MEEATSGNCPTPIFALSFVFAGAVAQVALHRSSHTYHFRNRCDGRPAMRPRRRWASWFS
jgi:hypothetical protein